MINLITSTCGSNKPYLPLLNDCRYLLGRFLQTWVVHVFREGNRCADALAKLGSNMAEEFLVFNNPPSPDVLYFVNIDVVGVSLFCIIRPLTLFSLLRWDSSICIFPLTKKKKKKKLFCSGLFKSYKYNFTWLSFNFFHV